MTTREKAPTTAQSQKPAPTPLATLTDLKKEEVQAVTEAINPLIANSLAFYIKLKNFHWHLSGSHFRDYHLMFDEHADATLASVDVLAERVRRIGGTTIRSVGHVSQLKTIEDDNSDFVPPGEMIRRLVDDDIKRAQGYRSAIEVCEKHRDSVTANVLEELLDEVERQKWFLFEVIQGQNNTD